MPSVFLSYSHKDEVWKDRLRTHLDVLEAEGALDIWDDSRIEAGADWLGEIERAIAEADVAVLLVSANFLSSKFIHAKEIPRLLQRRKNEGMTVIPVIIRSCTWQEIEWLRRMQVRPVGGQSLAGFRGDRRDAELAGIAGEIRRMLRTEDPERNRRDDFLSRVQTLCRHHEQGATVERCPAAGTAGDYLRVTRLRGTIRDVYPIGAVEWNLTEESFQAFLEQIDAPYRRTDQGVISVLVYGGASASPALVEAAAARRVHLVSFVEYQGLIDFRTYLARQTETLARDPIYPPGLYVPQRMRTLSILGREEDETADALAQVVKWLNAPLGRFIVLLGDFGTGKTFLLHELARRMGEAERGLVPVLLQMRSLEKGRTLDELLAQHFARERMDGFSPTKFRYMLEQGRIALLFDGFDELALRVTYAKAADHFATLLQAATGAAKVVLTSRRQHFLSDSQVKTALAEKVEILSGHRLAILQPFQREQVRAFLVNFFTGDEAKAEARLDLIDRVKDLLGLSANPRLLGFIAELPEEQLVGACAEGEEITAATLYQLLLDRWLVLEFDRVHPKGAPPGLSVAERWQAVTALALRLWQRTDRFVSLSDLSEEAARVVQAVGPAAPDLEVAAFQVGSGTLLVRDDEDNFAFLHQSILEWLVAKSAAEVLRAGATPEALDAREISPLMADFFASLAGREPALVWARSTLSAPAAETAKKNALLVLARYKETIQEGFALAGQDLRGWDLSGEDLSGEDLSSTDLSGSNLTAARLVGTRLVAARLVQATLHDADLSTAILTEANLTEADLTGARLLGADLRGACFTRTRLRRTRLLGAMLDPDSLSSADVSGAALDLLELGPQSGAGGQVSAVAWSPDGEILASATGSVIRVWEAQNGRKIRAFAGHQDSVTSVAFSPDGKSLASASADTTIRLWQVDSGREIKAFLGHRGAVMSVVFSPDGKSLASASDDHTIRLWQVDSGREIRAFHGHRGAVMSVAFSPDGESLASASADTTIGLWEVDSGRVIRTFTGHTDWIRCVTFSPDGKSLASASDDTAVCLWDVYSRRTIRTFHAHRDWVRSVAFSPDGKNLASASHDTTVCLWQVDTGRKIRTFDGHVNRVTSVAFSPDGKSLASASYDTTVQILQVDSGREIKVFSEYPSWITSVAFSPDGKSLASGTKNTVCLWQADSGREIRTFAGQQSPVTSVAFSPDGKSIAGGSADNTVRLWQIDSGRENSALAGHQSPVTSVAFSPDGKSIASASEDNTIRLWHVDSGREINTFSGHKETITSVAFSPDGKSLASGSAGNTALLWRIYSGRIRTFFFGHYGSITSVAFSPDGKSLASGSNDKTIRLWRVNTGRKISVFSGHLERVTSVTFSPDGKSLASASDDKTVRLWEVASGREIRALSGHQGPVSELVTFSPDGESLASGSDDGTIRLWNVADGRCLAVLLSLPEGWVAYSPDGRYKFGGVPAGGFWHVINLCRFEIGELDEWVPGLRLPEEASFFDLPPWKPELRSRQM